MLKFKLLTLLFAFSLVYIFAANALARETITICHSTGSNGNPYNVQHPDKSSDVGGHDGHNGGVYPTNPWGDIIPPFDYDGGHYDGKNWTTAGQAIYNNGCDIPSASPTPTPTPTVTPTPTPTLTPTPTITPCDSNENDDENCPTPTPTVTPTVTPTPTETPSNPGGPVDDGLGCSHHDCSTHPAPTTAQGGQVLGASTGPTKAVLGLSTTSGEESAMPLLQLLTALTSGLVGFKFLKKNA